MGYSRMAYSYRRSTMGQAMSRRLRDRGDKRERWEFTPWQDERDEELEDRDLPDKDDPPPSNLFH